MWSCWRQGVVLLAAAAIMTNPLLAQTQETGGDDASAAAEAASPDTVDIGLPEWDVSLVTRLSGSQAGFHNWAEGGVNSMAVTANMNGKATRTSRAWRQTHESRLAFGLIRQSGSNFRKAEDVIRLGSSVSYQGDGLFHVLNPTIALTIRTQFAAGYNYDRNPFQDGRTPPVKVSDFFAPATLQQSIGLSYDYGKWFSQRLGIGSKQTIVMIDRLRQLYGVDPGSAARYQVGVESRTDVDKEIAKNVNVKSTLGLFAAFNQPDLPDMSWDNLITMKVNSWLGVNLEVAAFYDRDVSTRLQIKEVLSIGVTVVFV